MRQKQSAGFGGPGGSAWPLGCTTDAGRQVAVLGQQRVLSWVGPPSIQGAGQPPPRIQDGSGVLATTATKGGQRSEARVMWGWGTSVGPHGHFCQPPVSMASELVPLGTSVFAEG